METKLSEAWIAWSKRGSLGSVIKRHAAERCSATDGTVRGYYSDLPLDPTLPDTHSLYPSIEHLNESADHSAVVVEARIFNDMKSLLSEVEFWQVVEHLYVIGQQKGHIPIPSTRMLPTTWSPKRHFE